MREPVTGPRSAAHAGSRPAPDALDPGEREPSVRRPGYWSELRCSVVGAADWSNYAAELFVTLEQHAPEHVHKIFGANALRCFPVRAPA